MICGGSRGTAHGGATVAQDGRLAVLRGLRGMGLTVWVLLLLAAVAPLLARLHALPAMLQLGLGLLGLHHVVVLVGLLLLRPNQGPRRAAEPVLPVRVTARNQAWLVALAAVLLALALLVASPEYLAVQPGVLWAPAYWALPWFLWALAVVPPRRHMDLLLGLGCFLVLVYLAAMVHTHSLHHLVDTAPLVWMVEPLAVAALFVRALLEAGRRRAAHLARQQAAERRKDRQQLLVAVHREANRLVQDHVLHALHALGQPEPGVTAEMVVAECRDAVAAIDRASSNARLLDVVAILRHDDRLAATGLVVQGSAQLAPARVARRFLVGVRRVLAASTFAAAPRVVVEQQGQQWVLRVFDVVVDRAALRASLPEVLDDLGGRAALAGGAPGEPVVEMCWPVDPEAGPSTWRAAVDRATRRSMPLAAWPGILAGLVMTVLSATITRHPVVAAANAVVVLGVGAWLTVQLRARQLRRSDLAAVALAVVLGWGVALWAAPSPLPLVAALWMVWGCSSVLMVVALQLRTGHALTLLAAWVALQVVGLLARFGLGLGWGVAGPVVGAGSGELFVGIIALALIRRLTAQDEQRFLQVERVRRATAEMRMGAELERQWSDTVTGAVLPAMRRVAAGTLDPRDPLLVADARRWAVTTREELVLGPSQRELIRALSRLREQGWHLGSSLGESGVAGHGEHFAWLLDRLGEPAAAGQALTLSCDASQATAVVLEPSTGQLDQWRSRLVEVGGQLLDDEAFARLQVPAAEALEQLA